MNQILSPQSVNNPLRDPADRRLPRIASPCGLVLFGVTGDLARGKLLPALYDLANQGLLPVGFALVGFARRDWTVDQFSDFVEKSVRAHCRTPFRETSWRQFSSGFRFVQGEFSDAEAFGRLAETLRDVDETQGTGGNHAFYLSVPPSASPVVCEQLAASHLATPPEGSWRRVVVEKPFGHDLESAIALESVVGQVFPQESIFRIDHYLGKETVQNLLALRFANEMFEPLWNSHHIDHVQITMAEDIGIAGRAGYYDGIGAARDVIQNHLLQLMALTAMDEPIAFNASDLSREKEKLLSAVVLPRELGMHTSRGQYAAGNQAGQPVIGFHDEDGIAPDSVTETFAAIRLDIDTRRWAGTPFYLRTGKRLGRRVTEIAIVFRPVPHVPFGPASEVLAPNALVVRVQPDEGVRLRFGAKVPGTAMEIREVSMDFGYGNSFTQASPEAYERLLLDVFLGDPPLFPRRPEVELSWKILDPVEEYWASHEAPEPYAPGSWGPAGADQMMARDGRTWRRP